MKIERYMFSTPAPWRIIVDSWGQTNYSRKLNISKYMIGGGFFIDPRACGYDACHFNLILCNFISASLLIIEGSMYIS